MVEKSKEYYTYILECSDSTFYTGMTLSIQKRLRQHNGQISGGARYTFGRRPVLLKYIEKHSCFSDAAKREKALKKLTRHKKIQIIKNYETNSSN
ncbi:MAG: GIY-YIG nuclease family protein [bacterium]|nr:GIY-YIG nuclease family protein [bacterium]